MSLVSPSQRHGIALLDSTRGILRHLENAAVLANRQVTALLALGDAALTSWLQSHAAELTDLLTRHAATGLSINAALVAIRATLIESGETLTSAVTVDVRPLAEKLAEQGRTIDMQTLTVSTPAPQE